MINFFNFFICGFMGCGKSTLAKLISQKTNFNFVDTDLEIEKLFKCSIPAIFAKFGELQFRKAETQILKKLVKQKNLIVATGGATLILNNNFKLLNNHCKIIFIDSSFEVCFNRIENSNRPLLKKLGPLELHHLFLERQKIYRKIAHETIVENTSLSTKTKLKTALTIIKQNLL